MTISSPKQEVVLSLDATLLRQVDELTNDLNGAMEEALRLWYTQKTASQTQVNTPVDYHRQRHNDDETGWLV